MTLDAGLEGFVKEQFGVLFEIVAKTNKRIDDLQETIGGVEQQVHEMRNGPPHVQLQYLDDRITKLARRVSGKEHGAWGSASERAEKAERERDEWKEQAEGWRFNHEEAIKRAERAEAERDANEKRMILLEHERGNAQSSVAYLRAILSRLAADDYRGNEPEYIRIAREALRAVAES